MTLQLIAWKNERSNDMGQELANKFKTCERIDILTGYFFFHGFSGLWAALEDNPTLKLRILVGMDAGLDTRGLIHRVYEYESGNTPENCSKEYLTTLKDLLAHPDPKVSVSAEQAGLYAVFAKMINDGRLEIRKTRHPNHAKVYVFHEKAGVSFAAGSSNFSYAGLCGRNEFNVHVADEKVEDVVQLFEALWNEALPITQFADQTATSEKAKSDPIATALVEDVPTKDISPFLAYMKVLREYLKLNHSEQGLEFRIRAVLRDAGFDELQYQIDAVSRAKKILDTNGGVIVADVVGLGKSVVGTLLAKLSDGPGVVIAPPHLVEGDSGWLGYIKTFKLAEDGWTAFSMYDPKLVEHEAVKNAAVVIIDEAHNVRNPESGLFKRVRQATSGKKVVCLTATPFNNRPDDLVSLVELFGGANIAGESRGTFIERLKDLARRYDKLVGEVRSTTSKVERMTDVEANIAKCGDDLRILISPLIVRRNRLDIKCLYADMQDRMPEQKLVKKTFKLATSGGSFYDDVVGTYFGREDGKPPKFKAAMYQPEVYLSSSGVVAQRQGNLSRMLRRFIVMRWESSPAAFNATLVNVKGWLEAAAKKFENEGIFISGSSINPVTGLLEDDGESIAYVTKQELADSLKAAQCEREVKVFSSAQAKAFKKDLEADVKTLAEVQAGFVQAGLDNPANDGKLKSLVATLEAVFNGTFEGEAFEPSNPRKVIVFSQYADTAKYVQQMLEKNFAGRVEYAKGGIGAEDKQRIETHFRASGAKAKTQEKTILVCTDVMSEGVNLNQAGVVVNYDISWNPVRTIQRIGRINRIDKKVFERIYAVDFFPADENNSGVEGISVRKMMMIHRILGEDAKVLSEHEEPQSFLSRITDLDKAEGAEESSEETKIKAMYLAGLKAQCGPFDETKPFPSSVLDFERRLDVLGFHFAKRLGAESSERLFIFSRNTAAFFAREVPDLGDTDKPVRNVGCLTAFESIRCDPAAEGISLTASESDSVWKAYRRVQDRTWGAMALPKLKGRVQKAWNTLHVNGIPAELGNRVWRLIASDKALVEDLLKAQGKIGKITAAVAAAEARIPKTENTNAVDLMVYGIVKEKDK